MNEKYPQTLLKPLASDSLKSIFKSDSKNPDRLLTRENSWLEFKQSFSWANKYEYAKTMAAFANAKGGYIVFGIQDKPRRIVGTDLGKFESVDSTEISNFLNSCLSSEVEWETQVVEVQSKQVIVIYIFESKSKPIIATQNGKQVLLEGEIYYRYRGRTQKIRYPELNALLQEQRRNEQAAWLKLFRNISKVGIENTALVDLQKGECYAGSGKFLIDKKSLPKLNFIKEGNFSEKTGAPTLRLIGDVDVATVHANAPQKEILLIKNIRLSDILEGFLNHEKPDLPAEYLKQICYESTAFLPIYFYARFNDLKTIGEIRSIVLACEGKGATKNKLIQLLEKESPFSIKVPSKDGDGNSAARYEKLRNILLQNVPDKLNTEEFKFYLEAIRCLNKNQLKKYKSYILNFLKKQFKEHYKQPNSDNFRRALCHVDLVLYKPTK